MHGRKIILAFCLICFVSSGSREQQPPQPKPGSDGSRAPQPVPPPPKPAGDGPSLEVTMKFIQDKLNEMGPITYDMNQRYADDDPTFVRKCTEELANVAVGPQGCTISFHHKASCQPGLSSNVDRVFDLKDVTTITVQSYDQYMNDNFGDQGKTKWNMRPPIFLVTVEQSHKGGGSFKVNDEELANRLARAITHAVELCTPDKQSEPF